MKLTKILALLLAVCMIVVCFASCDKDVKPDDENKPDDGGNTEPVVEPTYTDPYAALTHAEASEALYEKVLGGFNATYAKAKEASSVSERFALMAIAEAKLLEQGVMLPSSARGGMYAISRVAPRTISTVLWGNDAYRYHQALIVDGDPLTPAVRDEMKAKWNELKGTGTYEAWAKEYLAGKGYTLKDEYTLGYTSDPNTWDAFNTYYAADSEAIINTYDGLLEYDIENVQRPALATEYSVSEDGLTYTFKIREGVTWVDCQGKYIEDVTADSFVKGMQHMMDAQGGLEYLVDGIIKNASEYMAGEVTDFAEVGVKAVDKYTLEYTLEAPCSYFITMLGYGVFAPISDKYFLANGGAYGVDAFADASAADSYTYGTSFDKIAYCGAYLVTSATEKNSIVFEANPTYWNKDNINIKKITWRFISGQDPTEAYGLMKEGTFAGASLNTNALAKAKEDGLYEKYAYVSDTDATSFPIYFNLYRKAYANFNDETVAVSEMSDNDKVKSNLAMQNLNFRLALLFSLDREKFNAAVNGDDVALTSLVNSYTPGNFVFLDEDVTVDINGTATKFEKGTYYGAIMQAQMDADGFKAKVWDATADGGTGSSAGFDGWYNVENAKAALEKAIDELKTEYNMIIDAEHPVYIELPYYDINETYSNRANALKQSIEASLDKKVIVTLVKTGGTNALNWYNAAYYPSTGDLMNFTISDVSGWGPDYGDPATYLDTMLPQGGGMAKNLGLY